MQGLLTITWNDAYTSFCMLSGTSNNKVLKISLMILFYITKYWKEKLFYIDSIIWKNI